MVHQRLIFVFVLLAVAFFAPLAWAQSVFSFHSVAGDPIGEGQSAAYTWEDAQFSLKGDQQSRFAIAELEVLSTTGDHWRIELSMPEGSNRVFVPGTYIHARLQMGFGRSPGMRITRNGRVCDRIWGTMSIHQASYNYLERLNTFEATLVQHCDREDAPPLAIFVRYRAPRVSVGFDGEPGNLYFDGIKRTHYGATTEMTLGAALPDAAGLTVQGLDDDLLISIDRPGAGWVPGVYTFNNAVDPQVGYRGLRLLRFGLEGGEPTTTSCPAFGTLDIKRVQLDARGRLSRLYANFEMYCPGNPAVLKGKIHSRL